MSERILTFSLLLPLIFILHNIEEYVSFDQFKEFYVKLAGKILADRNVFFIAIIFLSIIAVTIIIANYFLHNYYLQLAAVITVFSIFFNGLQHCFGSLVFKKLLPGTLTSIFLIIPFTIIFIFKLKNEVLFKINILIACMLISVIVLFLAIFVSLVFGNLVNNLINFKRGGKNG